MYTRPRFLEELHAIREEMSRECDYDMDLFAQFVNDVKLEIIEQSESIFPENAPQVPTKIIVAALRADRDED